MPPRNDEFFVGYLPTPRSLRGFLWLALSVLLVLGAGAAALIASHMRDPGDGKWAIDHPTTIKGTMITRPYPLIWTGTDMVLVVAEGKHAAQVGDEYHRKTVEATGTLIERPSRRMIELPGEDASKSLKIVGPGERPDPIRGDRQSFVGEVIDPKCYLGAMKPGEGKPHKACAALCIRGGIPPMLRTTDADGKTELYLLSAPDYLPLTGAALDAILPLVASNRVTLEGFVIEFGDLHLLELPASEMRSRGSTHSEAP